MRKLPFDSDGVFTPEAFVERIKDELRIGRTTKQAFSKANKSSFLTIFDSNLTTVIAAAVLFFFGESSVKGFATMNY